jgi:apolipoprotein N-acyltransferase
MIEKIRNNRFFIVYLIPFLIGSMSVLSFQPFNFTLINFITLPVLFIILSYVRKKSKNNYRKKPFLKNLFLVGFFFGFGFFLFGNYWISYSLTFDDNFKFLIPFSLILLPMVLALFFAFASLLIGVYIKNDYTSILFFCSILAFSDYLRSKMFSGFPWNMWAYSWSWFTELLQILNPIGLFAFNLLILILFCTPAIFFFKKNFFNPIIIITSTIFFLCSIYGSYLLNKNNSYFKNANYKSVNIKVVSPNFDIKYNLSTIDLEKIINKLVKYSEPKKNKPTIFVWPEGSFVGNNFEEIKKYKKIIQDNFSKNDIIIFGINTENVSGNKTFNSLVAINNNFELIYKYNKKKLVPFGEFLPLEKYLEKLGIKKITQGYGSFSKGENQKNFKYKDLNILPVICYEIIFTEIFQKSNSNFNLIVNISEDAWFGNSIGPSQHFAKAIFRSIENDTFLVRSANKGISAIINNKGQVIQRLERNEAGNIEYEIPLLESKFKNKNDLIFFALLITYILIFFTLRNKLYD